jgi:4-phosphopantoate--beta-alanine ligase
MGKTVIAIDLNPLSRTAQCAHVTIVNNITRAVPDISRAAEELKSLNDDELQRLVNEFDNKKNLNGSIQEIIDHLSIPL